MHCTAVHASQSLCVVFRPLLRSRVAITGFPTSVLTLLLSQLQSDQIYLGSLEVGYIYTYGASYNKYPGPAIKP